MRLYICYGTFPSPRPGGHPCKNAYEALRDAGHDPELVRTYGLGVLPTAVNRRAGRGQVIAKTGQKMVPVLELDDGTTIHPSRAIVEWARENPATPPARSAAG